MAREIWVTFSYSLGVHPVGVPDEQTFLDAWDKWTFRLGASVKTARFIGKRMLDHTSVSTTDQYNHHAAHAVDRFDKMMIDAGGSKTDPDNYYTMEGLMLEFVPAVVIGGMGGLYSGTLVDHETYNAHWLQAEQAYKDELDSRNLTPDLLHYRTVGQPILRTDTTYNAAYATRHDDLVASLGDTFYPLTLPRLGARNYIWGAGDSTVESVEKLGAANVAENARLVSENGITADVVPVIFMRYEGTGTLLHKELLSDELGIALLTLSIGSTDEGGFAVWTSPALPGGAAAEVAKINEWRDYVLGRAQLGAAPISRTPATDADIDRTPDLTGGVIDRTPDADTDVDRSPDISGGVIDRSPDFDTERT